MKKAIALVLLMCLFCISIISCENKAERLAKAKELLNMRCNKCHFSDRIYKKKYTKEDWQKIIDRMVVLSKENPGQHDIAISHEDAFEILILLQTESGD